jgi:hypothetical protein
MEINGNQDIPWNWNGIHIFFGFDIEADACEGIEVLLGCDSWWDGMY